MDGFNSIPIQNNSYTGSVNNLINNGSNNSLSSYSSGTNNANNNGQNAGGLDIEIVDPNNLPKQKTSFGFLLPFSILALIAVIGYFGYLVFLRFATLQKVSILSENFKVLTQNINKGEMQEFVDLDNGLKLIKEKLQTRTQLSNVLIFVNKNIRNNLQITDYRIEQKGVEVNVILSSIAPSFRELAEQTEKMNDLKNSGAINSFVVTQFGLEQDGKRLRFNLNLKFDSKKVAKLNNPNI